jgi:hypothetical protein
MSSIAEKLNAKKAEPNTSNEPKKNEVVLRKSGTVNIFQNPNVVALTDYFIKSVLGVLIADAMKSIQFNLNHNTDIDWFSILVTGKVTDYLTNQFDLISNQAMTKAKGKKEIDLTDLEFILTQEQIETMKLQESKEYSFSEIKEYIISSFEDVTSQVIETLLQFKI